jgi:hypothetical protein
MDWRALNELVLITFDLFILQQRRCDTMAQVILCEVNNCTFWGSGNKCNADAIYVVSSKGKQASNSEETDCKTFEPES